MSFLSSILAYLSNMFTLLPEGSFWNADLIMPILCFKNTPQWLPIASRKKKSQCLSLESKVLCHLEYAYMFSFTYYSLSYRTLNIYLGMIGEGIGMINISWNLPALLSPSPFTVQFPDLKCVLSPSSEPLYSVVVMRS